MAALVAEEGQDDSVRSEAIAHVGGMWASGLLELATDARVLDRGGRWVVTIPYEGRPTLARFAYWSHEPPRVDIGVWDGARVWASSMDQDSYIAGVRTIQRHIAAGDVYQVNLCRVLTAEYVGDIAALYTRIIERHEAPHRALISIPECGLHVLSASPELFLLRRGSVLRTSPIKGTAPSSGLLREKDTAENIMIVDLMRNDLSRVAKTGSVRVPHLLRTEEHPGLVHLVSDVECELDASTTWSDILEATFPPGSVTGAPKSAAVEIIGQCEPVPREVYCGAVGWIDADRSEGSLAVAIRTFWIDADAIKFGTGAGITWGSEPIVEWEETELKASRLIALASGDAA